MNKEEILAEYDRDIRARPFTTHPDIRFEWDGSVFRFTGRDSAPQWNGVTFARLTQEIADDAIDRQIAHFHNAGHSFEWKLHDYDTPLDLARRLETAGFTPEPEEGFAVMDLAEPSYERRPPPQASIRKLTEPDEFNPIAGLNAAVYGNCQESEALVAHLKAECAHQPEDLSVYAAFAGELMICAGWIRFHGSSRFASLWGGATLPEWRKRGLYSALVAIRAREARERGARWLTVDCSPHSRPILERRGFRLLSVITPWIWTPDGD